MENKKEERNESTKITKKKPIGKIFFLLLIIVLFGGGLYIFAPKWLPYIAPDSMEATLKKQAYSIEYPENSNVFFHAYKNKGFYMGTRDDVSFRDVNGKMKMNGMYSMTNPIYKGEGDILAVADEMGKELYVYSPTDTLYVVEVEEPILCFGINEKGFSVVLTKNTDNYQVFVYNKEGTLQSEGAIGHSEVFPVAVDISNDGRIIAISSVDIGHLHLSSKVTFVYVTKEDSKDIKDGIFSATKDYQDEIIGKVSFLKDNHLLVVSDKKARVFVAEGDGEALWEKEFTSQMSHVLDIDSEYIVFGHGKNLLNVSENNEGLIEVYSYLGEKEFSYKAEAVPTYIYASFDTLVVGMDKKFIALDNRGRIKWEYVSSVDNAKVLPISNQYVLVASKYEVDLYKIVNIRRQTPSKNLDSPDIF